VYIYSSILGGNAVIANAASTHVENSDTELHPKQSPVLDLDSALDLNMANSDMANSLLSFHMPGIDVLRGIAILMVILFHGLAYEAPDLAILVATLSRQYFESPVLRLKSRIAAAR
jgi:hypothetical protein